VRVNSGRGPQVCDGNAGGGSVARSRIDFGRVRSNRQSGWDRFAERPIDGNQGKLLRTLNAISINLAEIAEALRLGVLPIPSSAQLRAKTITLIIVARQVVPEEVAREIARQLVSCTRIGGFASGSRFRKAKRKASGYWPSRFSWIPPIFRCFRRS
jgi:hypothetical protein